MSHLSCGFKRFRGQTFDLEIRSGLAKHGRKLTEQPAIDQKRADSRDSAPIRHWRLEIMKTQYEIDLSLIQQRTSIRARGKIL